MIGWDELAAPKDHIAFVGAVDVERQIAPRTLAGTVLIEQATYLLRLHDERYAGQRLHRPERHSNPLDLDKTQSKFSRRLAINYKAQGARSGLSVPERST